MPNAPASILDVRYVPLLLSDALAIDTSRSPPHRPQPEAAKLVFESGVKLTMVPLEVRRTGVVIVLL